MNRSDFFSYVKKSLIDTVKEVSAPFIEDDIKKVDHLVDHLAGIKWVPIKGEKLNDKIGYKELYIENRSISCFYDGMDVHLYDKVCQNCHNIVQYISYEQKLKCLECDTFITVNDGKGELQLKEYHSKCENGIWMIGIL